MNPSTNETNPSTNQSLNPINESTNPSKMEPVRKRGRPKKEKPPPRSQEDIDDMPRAAAPPIVERLDSTLTNMKGMKDLIKNAKNTVQKFGSALPSLLNESGVGPMLADLCDAYVHEKEYHAKVQNANQDFHGVLESLDRDAERLELLIKNHTTSLQSPKIRKLR